MIAVGFNPDLSTHIPEGLPVLAGGWHAQRPTPGYRCSRTPTPSGLRMGVAFRVDFDHRPFPSALYTTPLGLIRIGPTNPGVAPLRGTTPGFGTQPRWGIAEALHALS